MEYSKLPHGGEQISIIGIGSPGWKMNLGKVKRSIDWQLKNLKTDYIDFGFIHCLDEEADLDIYEKNGVLVYLMDMKTQGVVKYIVFLPMHQRWQIRCWKKYP